MSRTFVLHDYTRILFFFFSSRRRHTRWTGDWSSDVCSSDLPFFQCSGYPSSNPGCARGGELAFPDCKDGISQCAKQSSDAPVTGAVFKNFRSEERRVGKECRCWGLQYYWRKKVELVSGDVKG